VSVLSPVLRKELEASVLAARRAAESASRAAVEGLGVFDDRRPEHLDTTRAALRIGLRAKSRQLGADHELLIAECAYEQWHRLLFARFLAENSLLLHPQYKAPVTLEDCEELAAELGEPDGWSVAARFAAEILPGIFRLDDPCFRLRLAPEGREALEQILDALPAQTFVADDALGWVYQFWQKDKKDEVNASERKIGGADLGPVTQLFTENYMVRFLLENSLGAWWASRHPESPLVKDFEYLRFNVDGRPAAGSFDGWPDRIAEVTVMDPCCGSGHFLVEAFSMLWQMRAEEEDLSPTDAQDAVLRDNLFGLELDPRCVQIAMFAVALQAWKAGVAWRQLPMPNIACSGIPVKASAEEWEGLANGDDRLEQALGRLHTLFTHADALGSFIDPRQAAENQQSATRQRSFDEVDWEEVAPLFQKAALREGQDPAIAVLGAEAAGVARAAAFLSRTYALICTNPPFLNRNSLAPALREHLEARYAAQSGDLATAMIARSVDMADSWAVVAPQTWLFIATYAEMRRQWLGQYRWSSLARLGSGAFESISGEVVQVILWSATNTPPKAGDALLEIDASTSDKARAKAAELRLSPLRYVNQLDLLRNPGSIVTSAGVLSGPFVRDFALVKKGMSTGATPVFVRKFWEVPVLSEGGWVPLQSAPDGSSDWSGCSHALLWESERGRLAAWAASVKHLNHAAQAWRLGKEFWGKSGIAVQLMGDIEPSVYSGEIFDATMAVVQPKHEVDLGALWLAFSSGAIQETIRSYHAKVSIEVDTILNAPIAMEHWRRAAADADAVPRRWSNDPTQWLFLGRPEVSNSPLHVAVGRLMGYRWPGQPTPDDLDPLVDTDGIVCLPAVSGEAPAADRLQQLLAVAFGDSWSPAKAKELLEHGGTSKKNLADWLRDEFFKQHCVMFGHRPFVWHIWDGQRDGFAALINYHHLDRKTLEKLTYTYLGQDWVERQRAAAREEVAGAESRLSAALALQRKLEAILEGGAPYDIYVRWKEEHEQPIGWDPDLDDGVRLNVRPFVEAEVLRAPVKVHWRKDRGKNPDGSERINDIHLSLAAKLAARKKAGLR
jgi:hypothetical protein